MRDARELGRTRGWVIDGVDEAEATDLIAMAEDRLAWHPLGIWIDAETESDATDYLAWLRSGLTSYRDRVLAAARPIYTCIRRGCGHSVSRAGLVCSMCEDDD